MTSSSAKGSVHDNIIGALEARSARESVQESQKLEKLKALSAKKRPKNPHDDIEASPARKPIFKGRVVGLRILTADRCFLLIVICLSAISRA